MARKFIFTKKQLTEVIGVDFSYLKNTTDGLNDYKGNNEITTSAIDDGDENESSPLTTDKIGNSLAPKTYFGHRDMRSVTGINCSNNKGKILENNRDLENKTFHIPDEIYAVLKNNLTKYQNNKTDKGYKRLNNLINQRDINTNEMYRLKNFFDNADPQSIEFNMIGGDKLRGWVNNELKNATDISYNNKDMKRKMGQKNAFISAHSKDSNNGKGHTNVGQQLKGDVKIQYEI